MNQVCTMGDSSAVDVQFYEEYKRTAANPCLRSKRAPTSPQRHHRRRPCTCSASTKKKQDLGSLIALALCGGVGVSVIENFGNFVAAAQTTAATP